MGIFWKRFIAGRLKWAEFHPSQRAMNNGPGRMALAVISYPGPEAPYRGVQGRPLRKFRDLRAMSMTKNERRRAAKTMFQDTRSGLQLAGWLWRGIAAIGKALLLHQDTRNLSSRARFSLPRGTTTAKQIRREMTLIGRLGHGIARAIESLRGLRLSLVS